MFAEPTLGPADYLCRKASNIKVGFLDGKYIVTFCTRQAQRVKLVCKQMNTTFLYCKISNLKIDSKEGEQFKEEDRKEVATCGRKGSGIIE